MPLQRLLQPGRNTADSLACSRLVTSPSDQFLPRNFTPLCSHLKNNHCIILSHVNIFHSSFHFAATRLLLRAPLYGTWNYVLLLLPYFSPAERVVLLACVPGHRDLAAEENIANDALLHQIKASIDMERCGLAYPAHFASSPVPIRQSEYIRLYNRKERSYFLLEARGTTLKVTCCLYVMYPNLKPTSQLV